MLVRLLCAGGGTRLTARLSQVALPVHAHQSFGDELQLPVPMAPGTLAATAQATP